MSFFSIFIIFILTILLNANKKQNGNGFIMLTNQVVIVYFKMRVFYKKGS
jgi:hypothetical protein